MSVSARAADDPGLSGRRRGCPSPTRTCARPAPSCAWYDPWSDQRAADGSLPVGTGTFELLFQQVTGRYLRCS